MAPGTQFNEEPLRITLLRNIVLKAPLPPPRRHLSKNGWESLKPVIYELYIVRQQTARTVVEKLHANGYEATFVITITHEDQAYCADCAIEKRWFETGSVDGVLTVRTI